MTQDAIFGQELFGQGLFGQDGFITTVDGRQLRTMTAGTGDDLVVLEAGIGVSGLYWSLVHSAIATQTRVLAYERAGYGSSDPDGARSLDRLVDDLLSVVRDTPHRRLVLVGHSWGGPIVRVAAARLRARGMAPAGIVLVDQSDEHASNLYLSRSGRMAARLQSALLVPLARMGALRHLTLPTMSPLPPLVRNAAARASSTRGAARAAAAELGEVASGMTALIAAPPQLDGIGMTVISGSQSGLLERGVRRALVAAHHETARRHRGARVVSAPRSAHMVPITDPDIVAAEALRLLT